MSSSLLAPTCLLEGEEPMLHTNHRQVRLGNHGHQRSLILGPEAVRHCRMVSSRRDVWVGKRALGHA